MKGQNQDQIQPDLFLKLMPVSHIKPPPATPSRYNLTLSPGFKGANNHLDFVLLYGKHYPKLPSQCVL
jgi:hypothetical protein